MQYRTVKPRNMLAIAAVTALAVVAGVTILTSGTATAAQPVIGDGTSSATSGASCWGIKQEFAGSADGTYWVSNTDLKSPEQVYCDMTTDGGGWVLIGRGRDGWTWGENGQGSPAQVRDTITGPGAFAPAALSTATVNGLLMGKKTSDLVDGVRLVRSTNKAGTSSQVFTMFPNYDTWSWAMDSGLPLSSTTIDGKKITGATTTRDTGGKGTKRMWTYAWSSHGNVLGFNFGSGTDGDNNATSYLWENTNERYASPFTQVWIRPRIANSASGFTPIPAEGFPAETVSSTLRNRSEFAPWGVVGLDHTDETRIEPWRTNVLSMRAAGDRMFIGGRFTGVQAGPTGTEQAQPFLAAFDEAGVWIDSFRPVIDGRVWDMQVTPDNKLIIAGDFTNVNGVPGTSGMAALDPATGQVITSWKADVTDTNGRPLVRALTQANGMIYAAGGFNRITGGDWGQIKVSGAVSVSAQTGRPGSWRPQIPAAAVRIRATTDGARILMAGYFNRVNNDTNHGYFAITDASTGAPVPGIGTWTPSIGSNAKYQQAVLDLGDGRYAVGGSEHDLQLWEKNRTTMLDASVFKQGGDVQMIEEFDGVVYAGCHCGDYIYEGSNNYTTGEGYRAKDPFNLVGAWNKESWTHDNSWYPSSLHGEYGEGIWAAEQASDGCIWFGGDLKRGGWSGNAANDWLGGFGRFCFPDDQAPTTPTNLKADVTNSGTKITWGASTDNSGTVSYDVYRDDRVVAKVWNTSFTDVVNTGIHRYTVRAVDTVGNMSASPAPITVGSEVPATITNPIELGATWRYDDTGVGQAPGWASPTFDDGAWPSGPAMLGWGRDFVTTTVGATKPNTLYARKTFEIADPAQVKVLDIKAKVATGAVVYVNGVEVGRINMPNGPIDASTPASGYIWGAEDTRLKAVEVPGSLLKAGTNTIAVETHNVTANASRLLFDLQATAIGATSDNTAPTAPTLTATTEGTTTAHLAWTAATDDGTLGGYLVSLDGTPIAVTAPTATGYVHGYADVATKHTYQVTAFDMNGNTRASNALEVGGSLPPNPNLMDFGATWAWDYTEAGQADGWQAVGFDDSAWTRSPAELGFGDNDEATLITTAATPRPVTAYFRTTVDIADPAAFSSVLADLIRDDGAVVYVNGVEVGRDNLPAGPVTPATKSSRIISNRAEERQPVQISIPAAAFTAGTNTIAVEIHNSDRWSGDLSFALKLTGVS